MKMKKTKVRWIENAIFYEIYPTSFYDSNGDGIGDINGIREKIPYLKELGITAVWLNPIYKSPFKDGGYDVSDYYEIDKRFGEMSDLDALISELHENGIKIVIDLVIGHTSDKHPWFKKSGSARRNKYSDYYIWTNSNFEAYPEMIYGLSYRDGGYMKNYYASQPALNYGFNQTDPDHPWKMHYKDERLKPLREDILNMMRYYLDKGVDGFRVDMASSLVKDGKRFDGEKAFEDTDEGLEGIKWLWNEILGTLRKEYKDRVYMAEWVVPQDSVGKCGFDTDFLTHDTFAFNSLYRNEKNNNLSTYYERGFNYFSEEGKGDINEFIKYAEFLYGKLENKGMFVAPTGTHDEIRMATGKSVAVVKTIFAFLLTIKNIPMIYYGDELGIEHTFGINKDGGSVRTGARTPMLWTEERNGGFSLKRTTYLPITSQKGISVASQKENERSLLNSVKKLIKIRKEQECFNVGASQKFIETGYPVIYERGNGKKTAIVMINPSDKTFKRKVKYSEILIKENSEASGEEITLYPQSYTILLK